MVQPQAIAPDLLIEIDGELRLVGGRHKKTGRLVFPFPQGPEAKSFDRIPLSNKGMLWSWTVQRFRPKSPPYASSDTLETFKPYGVGYVELAGEIIVESRLEIDDFTGLKIGMSMELVTATFARGSNSALIYAFRPVA